VAAAAVGLAVGLAACGGGGGGGEDGQPPSLTHANLRLSDFPQGWTPASSPEESLAKHVFACSGVLPANQTTESAFSAKGPDNLNAISDVLGWPDLTGAQRAYAALKGPNATSCVESSVGLVLTDLGSPLSVSAKQIGPPAAAESQAVAYRVTVNGPNGAGQVAQGAVVLLTRGRATAVILGYRAAKPPLPPKLLPLLAAAAAKRLQAPNL
jgi:hypothetical protein